MSSPVDHAASLPTPCAARRGTALVTGPTAGIGHSFAVQLAPAATTWCSWPATSSGSRRSPPSSARRTACRSRCCPPTSATASQLARVEARLADRERPVELLVNNAGFGLKGRFLDNAGRRREQAMLDVLVTAVLRLTHAALGPMAERGHGGVINVSSVAAFLPRGTYSAAKAWVNSFSEWAAHEYAPRGVRVMALCPGFTRTEFHERMGVRADSAPGFLWLDVDDLVTAALHDFDRGRVLSVPSARYKAITTMARVVPTRVLLRMQGLGRK